MKRKTLFSLHFPEKIMIALLPLLRREAFGYFRWRLGALFGQIHTGSADEFSGQIDNRVEGYAV